MSTFDPFKPPSASLESPPANAGGVPGAVPQSVVALLTETRPWVKLIVILFFVVFAIMLLGTVAAVAIGSALAPGKLSALQFLPMLISLVFYIPPVVYLSRFARASGRLAAGGGFAALEDALRGQKSYWKYVGIFAIVGIGFLALGVAGGVMAALFAKPH